MKIESNRFALTPVLCSECQQYVWLEPYRKGEKYHLLAGRFLPVNVCRNCYGKFTFGGVNNEK